jgi:hypothetical protein
MAQDVLDQVFDQRQPGHIGAHQHPVLGLDVDTVGYEQLGQPVGANVHARVSFY